jgi:hypothetical protein
MASVTHSWQSAFNVRFVNNYITAGGQIDSAVAANPAGNFSATWYDSPAADSVDARVFRADGTAFGSQFPANSTTAGDQYDASVTALTKAAGASWPKLTFIDFQLPSWAG